MFQSCSITNGYCTLLPMLLYVPSSRDRVIGMQRFLLHWQTLLNSLVSRSLPISEVTSLPLERIALEFSFVPALMARLNICKVIRVSTVSLCRRFEGAGSRVPSISEALPRADEEFLIYFAKKLLVWSKGKLYSFFVYCVLFSSLYSEALTASWN